MLPSVSAHITFTADPGLAPGLKPLTLIDYQAGTSVSNTDGTNLDFTIANGQITITGSAVPEPSSIVMAATAPTRIAEIPTTAESKKTPHLSTISIVALLLLPSFVRFS